MTQSIVIFTYPSITGLLRNAMRLRRADKVILYRHADQRHPAFLNRSFALFAKLICRQTLEVRTITQFQQTSYSAEVLQAFDRCEFDNDPFVRWIESTLQLRQDASTRYSRRVSLERGFMEIAAKSAIGSEFPNDDVALYRSTHFADFSKLGNVSEVSDLAWVARLISAITAPAIIYARLLREFASVNFSIYAPDSKNYDLLVYEIGYRHESMSTGVDIGTTKSRHKKNNSTLVYVHDKSTSCQFISDIWRPDEPLINEYKSVLTAQGYNYVDWADFKVCVRRFVESHLLWARAALAAVYHLRSFHSIFDAARAIGLYTRESIIADNINARGTLGFDDYSERTIVRYQIARLRGRKTLCLQHSANDGIRTESEIATVLADYYLTMSEFTRDAFAAYWPEQNIIPFGYARLDDILPELLSRDEAANPFADRPNPNCPVVVIALPNIRSLEHFREILPGADEFLKFLRIATDRYKDSLNIYLRPKQLVGWKDTINQVGFPTENMLLDRDMLTAEYMYYADLVICNVGSGVMSESALLKTTFAMFDFFKAPTDIYNHFGRGFFNATADDMIKQLDLLAVGKPLEIDYKRTQDMFSDPYDPDRPKMIRNLIFNGAPEEARSLHSSSEPIKQAI